MPRTDQEKAFLTKYLAPLVGCTITGVAVKVEDGRCWPIIMARKPADKKAGTPAQLYELEISRDSEGNGPGWIFGLPHPATKEMPNAEGQEINRMG